MSNIIKAVVLLHLICLSSGEQRNNTNIGETRNVLLGYTECSYFFHKRGGWPFPSFTNPDGLVSLCQTQWEDDGNFQGFGPPRFATLYDTYGRIPLYSAYYVILPEERGKIKDKEKRLKITNSRRPDNELQLWSRVATNLCTLYAKPPYDYSIATATDGIIDENMASCNVRQALNKDYVRNGLGLDRGHLAPSHINGEDFYTQLATFSLTNAAPQYHSFNANAWREIECVARQSIIDLVPNEKVFIITGTAGTGNPGWMNDGRVDKAPVRIPEFFYKAVCYPGSPGKSPWAYAVVMPNVNSVWKADPYFYKSTLELQEWLFTEPLFGSECMTDDFGEFGETIFPKWDAYIQQHCPSLT